MRDYKEKHAPLHPSEKRTQHHKTKFQNIHANKTFDTSEVGQIILPPDISEL